LRGSIENQVKQIWKQLDGIGVSKRLHREISEIYAQNGHQVSELIHSFEHKDEIIKMAKSLAKFTKNNFGIKDMQQITDDILFEFVYEKINKKLGYRSISTYLSQLSKIHLGLTKIKKSIPKHEYIFSIDTIIDLRGLAKEKLSKYPHINKAYENPIVFRSELEEKYYIVFDLQYHYGLRVSEGLLIQNFQLNRETRELIIQGKGGYKRTLILEGKIYQLIVNELNRKGSYKVDYMDYYEELKRVVLLKNETWTGTHGLRYNYAQRQIKEYRLQGMSDQEARKQVSYEMGHHRLEILNVYTK